MERLPILKDNTSLMELLGKLPCETNELAIEITRFLITNRIPDRDNAAREALDVLQLVIGILAVLEEQGADVPVLIWEHTEKLIRRGWKVKRYITIGWRGVNTMAKVLYKINRKQTGEPTAEEKWHDEMALKHYLKYCTSEKCIRGPEYQKKANWHEGFCLECVFNPYNMEG